MKKISFLLGLCSLLLSSCNSDVKYKLVHSYPQKVVYLDVAQKKTYDVSGKLIKKNKGFFLI